MRRPNWMLEPQDRTAYHAIVRRGWAGKEYEYYPIQLSRRLPAIAIPLRESDPVVALDIQLLIDRVYCNEAYDPEIGYTKDPDPPLEGEAPVGGPAVEGCGAAVAAI